MKTAVVIYFYQLFPSLNILRSLLLFGLLTYALYLIFYELFSFLVKMRQYKLIESYLWESNLIGRQIVEWLEANIKDGVPVTKLYDPELVAMVERDQQLYDKIRAIDMNYRESIISPKELHRHMIELARGQHRQVH